MLLNSLRKFVNHPTILNISYLTIGNVFSQIISLVGAIYIPHKLGPEKYGIYNTVIAYVSIFTVFTFSGLNKVVIRESSKNLDQAKRIIEDTIGLRTLFSFMAALLCIIVALFINYESGTKLFIAIYSCSLIFVGFENSVSSIYQSLEKMKFLAILLLIKSVSLVSLTIIFLLLGHGILSLIIIHLAINLAVLIINIKYSKRLLDFNLFAKVKVLKQYLKPGINFTILEFLGILSGKIDIVMLSFLAKPEEVGIYALAYRIVEKGLIIRNPISLSLFPYYSKKFTDDKIINKIKLYNHTFIVALPAMIVCLIAILLSKTVILNFVGFAYIKSVSILNVLVLYLLFNYTVIPFGLFLQTSGKERLSVVISIGTAILNITLNYTFFLKYGIIGIAYSTLLVEIFRLFSAIVISELVIKKQIRNQ